jgi:PleD family two-component response regulator
MLFQPNHRSHILLVDDDPNLRMLLSYAIGQEGYQTTEASDGLEALDLIQKNNFDIILLDMVMPKCDGIVCCEQLTSSYQEKCPPIILITAMSDTKTIDQAFNAGASDFVTKPIHWPILRERLKRLQETIMLRKALSELSSSSANSAVSVG